MSSDILIRVAEPEDLPFILDLNARVFGPGRFARSAYRIREGTVPITRLCRVAILDGRLIATLRMTEIAIGGASGALLLGPLAVEPALSGRGYGKALVANLVEAARERDFSIIVLVGDLSYYGRFGFRPVPAGQIELPGPADPSRILALELTANALAGFRGRMAAVS